MVGMIYIVPSPSRRRAPLLPRSQALTAPCRCISFKDSACRCFGYAISKKRYVYTIDDDCFVAKDPTGAQINALQQHIENLLSPSTPFFFNTLYDPYAPGTDFVRGYPFSLREGAPTAVSHGAMSRRNRPSRFIYSMPLHLS